MKVYKLTLEPLSSFRTPLHSDTVFGHLMWALRYREGEAALVAFLDRYREGEAPLLVSAGFPHDTLPAPVLASGAPGDGDAGEAGSLANGVVGGMLSKTLEEDRYLPLAQWRQIAGKLSPRALDDARHDAREALRALREAAELHPVTHTAVDRITGSAREAQLFVTHEIFYAPGQQIDVWHKLADEDLLSRVDDWWRWVAANGFGRYKSAGRGAFDILGDGLVEAGGDLPQVAEPNAFVSLSAWVPARDDPPRVTYRTRVKRGKLAEALAQPYPWKKPLLMLKPGAVARLDGAALQEWYGRMVEKVHWVEEGVLG
ncbi:MAG: hypothetical protein JW900_04055, partial [Anaerolineae bacterium]|nr:hypothetical protein [Anaerolineae bacterium]